MFYSNKNKIHEKIINDINVAISRLDAYPVGNEGVSNGLKKALDIVDAAFSETECKIEACCKKCANKTTSINGSHFCNVHSTRWDKFYVKDDDFCSRFVLSSDVAKLK